MSTNHKSKGDLITVVADQAYAAGVGLSLTDRAGVCQHAAASGDNVEVALEGVYNVAKLNTDTVSQGQKLYWHTVSKYATTSSSGAKALGWSMETQAVSGTATVNVKLGGF
jgi:predicted RecA/RadA family phage recombinase